MRDYAILTAKERLEMQLPQQGILLSPWLLESSLNMIYAWRGVGKTHVALEIAIAVASGSNFLRWNAPNINEVVYIDGEMPPYLLNKRLENILNNKSLYPEKLWILGTTPDVPVMPDLGTIEGQKTIDKLIPSNTKLIIIDNLSCLVEAVVEKTKLKAGN